ncbi:hypothetical protein LCGC14_2280340 [marine sediment metagenome]|uniref:Ribosome recycling factor domain-containing protein n=1 Tax=marine sediment metagenome TaxID=412755 RepID=A0A0F9F6S3_9ZZZZ
MTQKILDETDVRMIKAIKSTVNDFASVRTGRANTSFLEKLTIDYYGTKTPLNQAAAINVPEPQLVVIQPWDKSNITTIEKAIQSSDLGLTPSNDGNVIRVPFPPLTEERRKELVKMVHKLAEDGRISVRNIRRDANEQVKSREKEEHISEDDSRKVLEKIQKLTDKHIQEIETLLTRKEMEIMEV